MAREVVVKVTDDIDGTADAGEVQFGYKGTEYTIDLGSKNAATFDEVMRDWIKHATEVQPERGGPRRRTRARKDTTGVRAWARDQGIQVSTRGRIPADVQAKYDATH